MYLSTIGCKVGRASSAEAYEPVHRKRPAKRRGSARSEEGAALGIDRFLAPEGLSGVKPPRAFPRRASLNSSE